MAALPLREAWKAAERAVIAGDVAALEQLFRAHPRLTDPGAAPPYVPSGPGPHYTGAAQSIIAREQHFESYARFVEHREMLQRPDSPVARFEVAVEAVIGGDVVTLKRLLHEHPELIRARSTRTHHSTLLHYVGANGIEGFRQKTPPNAVQITELLLEAGAEVDAPADMYGGGSTTLGLVATSIHPWLAGVQNALLETLLRHGAANGGVGGCLANGRGEAAEFLAGRGAPLSFAEAAGVGRVDLVQSCFNADGSLKDAAAKEQLKPGLSWACQYGRTKVVAFLLQAGFKLEPGLPYKGETGLHWAAYGGHAETVKFLLEHGAPLNARDSRFGGTPLGWALYGWGEAGPQAKSRRYHEVVAQLIAAGATVDPTWLNEGDRGMPLEQMIRDDSRMRAALRGVV
jgi:ankyrin repeat protein